jgi:predicted ATP-grasp superfamily ATP-dependent carboligase
MAEDLTPADLTFGEKTRIAGLVARMAKRGMAGMDVDISDLQRKVERIENQARRRKQKP